MNWEGENWGMQFDPTHESRLHSARERGEREERFSQAFGERAKAMTWLSKGSASAPRVQRPAHFRQTGFRLSVVEPEDNQPPSFLESTPATLPASEERGTRMEYRCVATTLEGFVQRLAASLLPHGYWFYVSGVIPERKDPQAVDEKLLERYGIACSRWERARRKRAGRANMHYLRLGRFFVLLATHGRHRFFEDESQRNEHGREVRIRDFRATPLRVGGYSISFRGGRSHVRIDGEEYARLKAHLLNLATHRGAAALASEFQRVRFEPYAPVRRQLLNILRAVNRERKKAGFAPLPYSVLRLRRRAVGAFDHVEEEVAA
jgi:hypothetical protein